ncbi:hypothetical protein V8C44DRAFT_338814 [Trichoderma aethiopicum]
MYGVCVPAFRPLPEITIRSSATRFAQDAQVQQGTEAQTEHMCMQTVQIDNTSRYGM